MRRTTRLILALLATGLFIGQSDAALAQEGGGARLPREVVEAASAYQMFVERAAAIEPRFADGEAIRAAMVTSETWQPQQLGQGATAYAALIAMQDPSFVAGVRRAGADPAQAETLVRALEADPRQVAAVEGADAAASRINAALIAQAERLAETGRRVKQSAYDIQHQAWSRATVPDGAARLALAKQLADLPVKPTADDVAHLFQVAAAPPAYAGAPAGDPPGYTPVVQRALTLAALAILGRADHAELENAGLLRVRAGPADCMLMARLNLHQCLAVAGPHYEDIFCMGEHALKETSQCLREGAGAPARIASTAALADRSQSYAVPIAYASQAGH
ncbi:hypothetical protein [Phenylobacterium montanum]|uniref:Secreted protein n=1 Tax=Phenylobacterium montanum TaxID=2823693 RepID=A0A975G186_9CAUL|nr:hypothetical protein [Caulobacter sp. S6]QUD89240.1 hypothetical protein KCG34_04995 [Caulobacter sp. S6]